MLFSFIIKCLIGNFDLRKETHLNHSSFKCDVCNCFFKQKNCLIQHKGTKKHLTKLKWLADQEKKDRPSKPLDISNDEAEDINGNDFKCDQCSFSTKKKWNLIQHQVGYLYGPKYLNFKFCTVQIVLVNICFNFIFWQKYVE